MGESLALPLTPRGLAICLLPWNSEFKELWNQLYALNDQGVNSLSLIQVYLSYKLSATKFIVQLPSGNFW